MLANVGYRRYFAIYQQIGQFTFQKMFLDISRLPNEVGMFCYVSNRIL
jgi:hypothetical protein